MWVGPLAGCYTPYRRAPVIVCVLLPNAATAPAQAQAHLELRHRQALWGHSIEDLPGRRGRAAGWGGERSRMYTGSALGDWGMQARILRANLANACMHAHIA